MRKIWYGQWKWLKRVLVMGFLAGLLGIAVILGINQYIRSTAGKRIDREVKKVDCILVLGAGLTQEGSPSLVLRDRLDRGIELYEEGVSDRLLMSGDHGREGYDEVRAMKQYAVDAGVDPEDIFMDHAGFSTYESIYRARDVFQVKSLVIVTQPYHEYRAVYIAMKLGLDVYGTPSKATQYQGSWMLEAREKLARTKEFFNVMIQPEPTYLGEAIPISGSGSQTDDTEQTWKPTVSQNTTGHVPSIEEQVEVLIANQRLWLVREDDLSPWDMKYAVTDLNQNGRLELIVTSGPIGSAGITYSWFYELSKDCKTLTACPLSSDKDENYELAGSDLYEKKWTAYYDFDTGQYSYRIVGATWGGAGYGVTEEALLSIKEQKVDIRKIAGVYQKPSKKPPYVKKDYYIYGKDNTQIDTDSAGYKKAIKRAYEDYAKKKISIRWMAIREQEKDLQSKLLKSCEGFRLSD